MQRKKPTKKEIEKMNEFALLEPPYDITEATNKDFKRPVLEDDQEEEK